MIIDEALLIPAVNNQRGNKLMGTVSLAEDFAQCKLRAGYVAIQEHDPSPWKCS